MKYAAALFCIIFIVGCADYTMFRNQYIPQATFEYSKDVLINYEVYGNGEINVVFLHGFGASLNTWNDIKVLFNGDIFKLYLIDLKGFGFSSKPKDDNYTIEEQANIICSFIKSFSLDNIILVGHSYGGAIALLAQIKFQDSGDGNIISNLVLIDPSAYADDIPFFISYLRTPIFNHIILGLTSARYRAKYILNHLFYDKNKISDERIEQYAGFFHMEGSDYVLIEAANQIIPSNHASLIRKYKTIKTPTLIIWGYNDPALSVEDGKRLHNDIKNSELNVIDKCGHIPQEELPTATFKLINDFINLNHQ